MKKRKQYENCYMIDFNTVTAPKFPFRGRKLDTLGQIGTEQYFDEGIKLHGLGSCLKDKSRLTARAKRKHISNIIIAELIKMAQKKGDSQFEKYFKIASRCLKHIVVSDNRLYGRYCRSRACLVCNAIRKAQMINKYLPLVETWEDPFFVTLSAKSCYAKDLDERMKDMICKLQIILTRLKKRNQRGKGPKIIGVRSLECNFNATNRWYNPHFHLIVQNREAKKALIVEWLREWGKKNAGVSGQHSRRIKKVENDLIETIKYGSKIFSEPDPNAKNKKKATRYVYISALYNIYSSMRGIRLFERFGFQKVERNDICNSIKTANNFDSYSYNPEHRDWINEETGALLSGFVPEPRLEHLLNNRLVSDLE